MTIAQFTEKYNQPSFIQDGINDVTLDILMITIANLSDLHFEKQTFTDKQMDNKLNSIKEMLWDLRQVIKQSE